MNKTMVDYLRGEVDKFAKELASKHDLTYKPSSATYNGNDCWMKVTFAGKDINGKTSLEAAWDNNAELHGMKKEWLGMEYNGNKIVGFNTSMRKYPVFLEAPDGSGRKTTVASTINWMKLQEVKNEQS